MPIRELTLEEEKKYLPRKVRELTTQEEQQYFAPIARELTVDEEQQYFGIEKSPSLWQKTKGVISRGLEKITPSLTETPEITERDWEETPSGGFDLPLFTKTMLVEPLQGTWEDIKKYEPARKKAATATIDARDKADEEWNKKLFEVGRQEAIDQLRKNPDKFPARQEWIHLAKEEKTIAVIPPLTYSTARVLKSAGLPFSEEYLQGFKEKYNIKVQEDILNLTGKFVQLASISQATAGLSVKVMKSIGDFANLSPVLARSVAYGTQRAVTWGTGSLVDETSKIIAGDEAASGKIITEPLTEATFGAMVGSIHAIGNVPTKAILAAGSRGAWTWFREAKKEGRITDQGIKNIWMNAALGALVETIGGKQLQKRWAQEDWARFEQSKILALSLPASKEKELKLALQIAKASNDIPRIESIERQLQESGFTKIVAYGGLKLRPPEQVMNLSQQELNVLQKGIKGPALNLALKEMPASAMALKQETFQKYLGKVIDNVKDGQSYIEAFQTATEGIPIVELSSKEAEKNVSEKMEIVNETIAIKEEPAPTPENILKKESREVPINKYRRQLEKIREEIEIGEAGFRAPDPVTRKWYGVKSTYPKYSEYLGGTKKERLAFIDKILAGDKLHHTQQNKLNRFLKIAKNERDKEAREIREERLIQQGLPKQQTDSWLNSMDKLKQEMEANEDVIRDMSGDTDANDMDLYGNVSEDGFDHRIGDFVTNEKGQIDIGIFTDAPFRAVDKVNKGFDEFKLWALKFPNLDAETKANLRALRINPEVLLEESIKFYADNLFSKYLHLKNEDWDKIVNAGELYQKGAPNIFKAMIANGQLPAETEEILQINEALAQWHLKEDTSRKLYKEGFPQSFINKADKSIAAYQNTIEIKGNALRETNDPKEKEKYAKIIKRAKQEIERQEEYKKLLANMPYFPRYMNRQELEAYIEEKGLKSAGTKELRSMNLKFKKFIGRKIPAQAIAKELGIPYEPNLIKRWVHRSTYSWQKWLLHDYLQEVINEGTFIKPDYQVEGDANFVDAPSGFDQLFKDQVYLEDELTSGEKFNYKMDKYFKHGLEEVIPKMDTRTKAGKALDTFQAVGKQLKFHNPIMMGLIDTGQSLRIEGHWIPIHPKEWSRAFNDYFNHAGRFKDFRLGGMYKQNILQVEDAEKLVNVAIDAAVGTPFENLTNLMKKNNINPAKWGMDLLRLNKKVAFGLHEVNLTMMGNFLIEKRGFTVPQAIEHATRALGGSDFYSKDAAKWMHRVMLTPQFTTDGFMAYGNIARHPWKEKRAIAAGVFAHMIPNLIFGWMGWKAWSMTQEGRMKKTVMMGPDKRKEMEKVITLPSSYFWLERITGRKIEKSLWYRWNTLPQFLSRLSTFWYAGGGELRDFTGKIRVMKRKDATETQRYEQLAKFIISDFFAPFENLTREQQEELKKPIEKIISLVFATPIYYREPRDNEMHPSMKWINRYLNEPGTYTIEEISKMQNYELFLRKEELDEKYLREQTSEQIQQFNRDFNTYYKVTSSRERRRLMRRKEMQYKQRLFEKWSPKAKQEYFSLLPKEEQELVKGLRPKSSQALKRSREILLDLKE